MTYYTNLKEALSIQARVFSALSIRYIVTRYGRDNIGFVWVVVEPMLLCLGVMGMWSLIKGSTEHGVQITAVVFTGYMPLTLWRHLAGSTTNLLRSAKQTLNFRIITAADLILSRLFLEFISVTTAGLTVYLIINQLGVLPDVYEWGPVITGWLMMAAMGAGFGLIVGTLTEISDVIEKFLAPIQYLILPICGCFFMLDWLPDEARKYASYVPLVHAYETIRGGYFGPSIQTYGEPSYSFAWAAIGVACGLIVLRHVQHNIRP